MDERPPYAGTDHTDTTERNSLEYNADLQAAAMAKELVQRLGTPSIISKRFATMRGLIFSLNHTETNKTGLDTSLLLLVFDKVAADSVNINGNFFERIWSYLMKPKYIISGLPQQGNQFDEQESNWFVKQWHNLTGKGNKKEAV